MKEFVATLKKNNYVGGKKVELTREVVLLSVDIASAFNVAKREKGWSLDPADIHEVSVSTEEVEEIEEVAVV